MAMRRKLLQPQCSSGCKEKSFVAGCTSVLFLLFFFFFSPPPIISILTQSSIVTDIVTNYLFLPTRQRRVFLHPSLLSKTRRKRDRDINITIFSISNKVPIEKDGRRVPRSAGFALEFDPPVPLLGIESKERKGREMSTALVCGSKQSRREKIRPKFEEEIRTKKGERVVRSICASPPPY